MWGNSTVINSLALLNCAAFFPQQPWIDVHELSSASLADLCCLLSLQQLLSCCVTVATCPPCWTALTARTEQELCLHWCSAAWESRQSTSLLSMLYQLWVFTVLHEKWYVQYRWHEIERIAWRPEASPIPTTKLKQSALHWTQVVSVTAGLTSDLDWPALAAFWNAFFLLICRAGNASSCFFHDFDEAMCSGESFLLDDRRSV